MDSEFKQRLIGAVVVTALAAIFVPMLFDDPVDNAGKAVTEVAIPPAPTGNTSAASPGTPQNLPQNPAQALDNQKDSELTVSEAEEVNQTATPSPGQAPIPPATNTSQTPLPGMPADLSTGSSTPPATANPVAPGGTTGNQVGSTTEPTLDTGEVEGVKPAQTGDQNTVKSYDASKSLEEDLTSPTVAPMPPDKPITKVEEPKVQRHRTVIKDPEESAAKPSGSKLGRYAIQAGSFNKHENAEALIAKLRKAGLPATIVTKGDLYRVKVGPSLDKAAVKDMKAKLDKLGIKGLITND